MQSRQNYNQRNNSYIYRRLLSFYKKSIRDYKKSRNRQNPDEIPEQEPPDLPESETEHEARANVITSRGNKIAIASVKSSIDSNKIARNGLYLSIAIVLFTFLLYLKTLESTAAAVAAAKTADSTFKEQRHMDSLQTKSNRDRDSTDSAKYVKDTTADNARDAANLANQERLYHIQQEGVQAQIKSVNAQTTALRQTQKDFELENRPFVILSNIRADTTFTGNQLTVSFTLINEGKFPAKILNVVARAGIGVDTNHIIKITPTQYILNNEFIGVQTFLNTSIFGLDIAQIEKYQIKKGQINIYLFADLFYETFGTEKSYESKVAYELNYTNGFKLKAILN